MTNGDSKYILAEMEVNVRVYILKVEAVLFLILANKKT